MNMTFDSYRELEQFEIVRDPQNGLEAVIAIHSTGLGPAAGGCRLWAYEDVEQAKIDAFRLAEGMSYKNALAGLPLGGGKAVIRKPAGTFSRDALFRAFGRAVSQLNGRYVTAEDVGTSVADMLAVSQETRHVAGLPPKDGRPGGDPSPWTALGVFLSMETSVRRRLGNSLSGSTVGVQGLGHVGFSLAKLLHDAGAKLVVADLSKERVDAAVAQFGAKSVAPEDLIAADLDVFAPCALGAVLNEGTIGRLRAKVICGAANNQLATDEDGRRLADRDILYAPDYVVNSGGIINVAAEYLGWSSERAKALVEDTGARLDAIFDIAAKSSLATHEAANQAARAIIASKRSAVSVRQ
ncbi:Leu/Phe/Val dehydrogenase [Rhizobium miluonense]|uniref:Leucine dehydrogenase n=1 Tax=Rhizobium miluonense TaxID=411945 RepID=A0A1C3WZS1_9HYPH|nr:Glu/Leu/Phe/Val dehydrogenase dimerization domain-containing protein [Rhizobium miluonense]SCB45483.1 leucine dehydrogenase [Rhizobium miluonense]